MPLSINEQLLLAIRNRLKKSADFNSGILTADAYLRTLQDCVGSDLCNRFCSKRSVSWHDQIKRASSVLTYNNPDMVVEDLYTDWKSLQAKDVYGDEVELPKNTLMVFKHTLTTPRKDRDGDILRTKGARPDPNMLLLWQHQHALPIGKMLAIHEHTSQKLVPITAIVDVNELAHDAAVMVENKMGRFSHGFKALDFTEVKEIDESGRMVKTGGFDIKSFEIMEESLVSVPSNIDSETEEIILSLVSNGKMTSPLMKSFGKSLGEKRNQTVSVLSDLTDYSRYETKDDEQQSKQTKCACGCGGQSETCTGKPTPKKTDDHESEKKDTDIDEMNEADEASEKKCPKCGKSMKDGKCECGYTEKAEITAKAAMAVFLAKSNAIERKQMADTLDMLKQIELSNLRGKQFDLVKR